MRLHLLFAGLALLLTILVGCDEQGKTEVDTDGVTDVTVDVVDDTGSVEDVLADQTLVDLSDVAADLVEDDTMNTELPNEIVEDLVEVWTECPPQMPTAGVRCEGSFECEWGQECCCGDCFASERCFCNQGTFACMATDACFGGGWCTHPPCCSKTKDQCSSMDETFHCSYPDNADFGKCLPLYKHPQCWHNEDCSAEEVCQGAAICPCDADCDMEDTPGTCVVKELLPGCCLTDADCDVMGGDVPLVCSWNDMSELYGRCMSIWQEGQCWDDGDCADGLVCQGAFYCPCDMFCGAPDVPGTCMDPNQFGDVGDPCGPDGGQCKEGLSCCYPCGIGGCIWQCAEPCDESEPWCEGGCPLLA